MPDGYSLADDFRTFSGLLGLRGNYVRLGRKLQIIGPDEVLTDKDHFAAARSMEPLIEQLSDEVAILHWKQFPGTPREVSGLDIFVVRNGKVVIQSVYVDPAKH